MQNYTKNQIKTKLVENTSKQPKAIYSNRVLLAMLENCADNVIITCEPTRSNEMLNRGSIAECLAKAIITGNAEIMKSSQLNADLDTTTIDSKRLEMLGLPKTKNLEIKFSTSFANATPKSNKARYTLVLNQYGAYLVESKLLAKDKKGHITPNQWNGVRLDTLSKMLGY